MPSLTTKERTKDQECLGKTLRDENGRFKKGNQSRLGIPRPDMIGNKYPSVCNGEKSSSWKGEKAKYNAKHMWIRKNKPKPKFCENCGQKSPREIANISGKHKRDINDYEWLCHKCHVIKDGRINNFWKKEVKMSKMD